MQGSELKAIRKWREMTQAEFAAKLGVSSVFVGMMERGERPVDKRTELQAQGLMNHYQELPEGLGIPTVEEFQVWQAVFRARIPGGSADELVGLQVVDGKVMGICRAVLEED